VILRKGSERKETQCFKQPHHLKKKKQALVSARRGRGEGGARDCNSGEKKPRDPKDQEGGGNHRRPGNRRGSRQKFEKRSSSLQGHGEKNPDQGHNIKRERKKKGLQCCKIPSKEKGVATRQPRPKPRSWDAERKRATNGEEFSGKKKGYFRGLKQCAKEERRKKRGPVVLNSKKKSAEIRRGLNDHEGAVISSPSSKAGGAEI